MDLKCPDCQSDNTQKLSLIVEGGTSKNSSTSIGIGSSQAGLGLGGATTSGTSTTKLAEKHASPYKCPIISAAVAIIAIAWIASLFFGGTVFTIGLVLAALSTVFGIYNNLTNYPGEMEEWQSKYICLRCSSVFAVNQPKSEAASVNLEESAGQDPT